MQNAKYAHLHLFDNAKKSFSSQGASAFQGQQAMMGGMRGQAMGGWGEKTPRFP